MKEKPDVLQGTLALMVLKTLDVLGPQHGWGIARRVEQIRGDLLAVNQGTPYGMLMNPSQSPFQRMCPPSALGSIEWRSSRIVRYSEIGRLLKHQFDL